MTTPGANGAFWKTPINHQELTSTDAESISIFLCKYDQYCKEVAERAKLLNVTAGTPTDPILPVNLKFRIDTEYLDSAKALGFLEDVADYTSLTEPLLCRYLAPQAEESKDYVNLEMLDKFVERELRMNMFDRHAKSRLETFFVSYYSILWRDDLEWLLPMNQKVCVWHVFSAIKPTLLQDRLTADLDFGHNDLKKNFNGFLKHELKFSEAFQLVNAGPRTAWSSRSTPRKRRYDKIDLIPVAGTPTKTSNQAASLEE